MAAPLNALQMKTSKPFIIQVFIIDRGVARYVKDIGSKKARGQAKSQERLPGPIRLRPEGYAEQEDAKIKMSSVPS